MTAHVLVGSKQEIAEKVAIMEGNVREAIVFTDEPSAPSCDAENPFAEMEPFTVKQLDVDDSRDAIYQRAEGE